MARFQAHPELLSTLIANPPSVSSVFGIIVDGYQTQLLEGVDTVGFLAMTATEGAASNQADARFTLSLQLSDVIIQYRQAGKQVFLQIPSDFPISSRQALQLIHTLTLDLVLMPPEDMDESSWRKWADTLVEFTELALSKNQFSAEVIPVSSFLTYMCLEAVGKAPESMYSDDLIEYFVGAVPSDLMEEVKQKIRASIYQHFGGEEAFRTFVKTGMKAVGERAAEVRDSALSMVLSNLSGKSRKALAGSLFRFLAFNFPHLSSAKVFAIAKAAASRLRRTPDYTLVTVIDVLADAASRRGCAPEDVERLLSMISEN